MIFNTSNTDLLIKHKSEPDLNKGINPHKRPIEHLLKNGIIFLDKPKGPTCNEVDIMLKRMLNLDKVGHAGTLDPNVSGVLPILLSNSTKILQALQGMDKEYITILELHSDKKPEEIKKAVNSFKGKIQQMPPVKSAVKRQLREREIYNIEVLEIKDRHVLFRAHVEAGTYIRTLCTAIGEKLNTKAHMHSLRRIRSGPFKEDKLSNLHDIKDAIELYKKDKDETEIRKHIFPIEKGIEHLKKIIVKDSAISSLLNGAPLHVQGISQYSKKIKKKELVAVLSLRTQLIGLAECQMKTDRIRTSSKGIAAKTKRIIMENDTYPKNWKTIKEKETNDNHGEI